jgi:cell division protein FtsZ
MGTGYGDGDNRAVTAADNAIHSPLLDDISIVGAKGILINITGGEDMTLYDVNDATQTIYDAVGENVETNIIFGAVTDKAMNGKISVTVIATGFNEDKLEKKKEDRNNAMFGMKITGNKNKNEIQPEQMSIVLPASNRQEESVESIASADSKETAVSAEAMSFDETQKAVVNALGSASATQDFSVFLKKETMKKDPHFVVSKGNIIEHYEDDMDVPTFLRKQMQ